MLHFTCDLCGQPLNDERFVARIEVHPAFDPDEITEDDLDSDHLEEVAAMIEQMELTGEDPLEECSTKTFRYDLCRSCHCQYVRDPLGRERQRRLNFSEN